MYATPVIYAASSIPARFGGVIQANPLTPIVEVFRYAFLGPARWTSHSCRTVWR